MRHTKPDGRIIRMFPAALLAIALLPGTAAAAQERDGAALAEECAARNWSTYMNCQRELIEVRRTGNYCVALPENAARYQVEFVRFAQENPALVSGIPAPLAAAAYFTRDYGCG